MTKISQYTTMTTLQSGDLMDISEDLGGSYGSRSLTYSNLLTNLNADLTGVVTLGAANQVPYMNPGATDFVYSANLTFTGSLLTLTGTAYLPSENELRLGSNTANYNAFKSPTGMGSNLTYTLPSAYPTSNGQVLASTTAGTMTWDDNTEPVIIYVSGPTPTALTAALAAMKVAGTAGIIKIASDITLSGDLPIDFDSGIEIWGGGNQIICGANKLVVAGTKGTFRNVNFDGNVVLSGATTNGQSFIEVDDTNMTNFKIIECSFNDVVGGSAPAGGSDSTYPIVITNVSSYSRIEFLHIGIGTRASGSTKAYGPFLIKWNDTGRAGVTLLFNSWHNRSPEAISQSTRWATAKDSMVIRIDNGAAVQPSVQRQFIYDGSVSLDTSTIARDSGTTTSTTANKLVQTGQNFLTTVAVGDTVNNTPDATTAKVSTVDSDTQLSLDTDIMTSGEAYTITSTVFTLDLFPTFYGPTTKIAAVNPTSVATFGNPGDILVNSGTIYMKHTAVGSDTNWSQIN